MTSRYTVDTDTQERVRVMAKIVNQRLYDPAEQQGETYVGITSKTVPDMSLTMEEIVQRHLRGAELPDQGNMFNGDALFPDGTPMPDFARMSKTEIHQYAKDNAIRVELIQRNLIEANKRYMLEQERLKNEELESLRKQKEEWDKVPKS